MSGVPVFPRRYYASLRQFLADIAWLLQHRAHLRQTRAVLSPAFRECLMLAVTAVNRCRYCSFAHTRMALAAGVSNAEIAQILDQTFSACPPDEAPALAYAQHWADTDAAPDPAARERLFCEYGVLRAHAIETVLRMIRVGNLLGNTFDYLLFRLSSGRFGLTDADRRLV
ncbi:MAG: carboxymuconolactone decarboxylase family protein [Roseiflexus sp.]|nr:carboxymuconolactone decarboxylase family protein [Roseiflexus sp.]MCS7291304.1 carboxymuconolactone decarboxylase family protein [Roseiflexus sp.]MDW8146652.1 carboxymuconolactone decarboxylase family protein [Roseiflexaceae bacterium]